jgi:small subunit ribosomal protein S1
LIDYGAKSEGVIPKADLLDAEGNLGVQVGDKFDVTVTGYNKEDMATLSRVKGPRPGIGTGSPERSKQRDCRRPRHCRRERRLTVDVGTRAFLPSSRSGAREGRGHGEACRSGNRCRIIKLDVDDEDVVVDRRSVMEEEATQMRQKRASSA